MVTMATMKPPKPPMASAGAITCMASSGGALKKRFQVHAAVATQHQALQQSVNRRGDPRPLFLEDGDDGDDEAANAADGERRRHHLHGLLGRRVEEAVPGPRCRRDAADEQDARLVDRARHGHALAEYGLAGAEGVRA